jgi:hypothetical protein
MAYYHKTNGYMQDSRRVNGRVVTKPLHRMIWELANGPIPAGMVIHHRNGVKIDNRIENLELLEHSKHSQLHIPIRSWEPRRKRKHNTIVRCMRRRLPKAIVDEILSAWRSGESLASMRKRFGLHDTTIKALIVDHGATNR